MFTGESPFNIVHLTRKQKYRIWTYVLEVTSMESVKQPLKTVVGGSGVARISSSGVPVLRGAPDPRRPSSERGPSSTNGPNHSVYNKTRLHNLCTFRCYRKSAAEPEIFLDDSSFGSGFEDTLWLRFRIKHSGSGSGPHPCAQTN